MVGKQHRDTWSVSVKSDRPMRPGGCSWRKITSRSGPLRARHLAMRRSNVRRTPRAIPGSRRQISSKMATARMPGAVSSIGTISLSHTPESGSGRRRPRGFFFWDGSHGLFDPIGGGGADPQAWLTGVLGQHCRIIPAKRIAELLPWNWKQTRQERGRRVSRPSQSMLRCQRSFPRPSSDAYPLSSVHPDRNIWRRGAQETASPGNASGLRAEFL